MNKIILTAAVFFTSAMALSSCGKKPEEAPAPEGTVTESTDTAAGTTDTQEEAGFSDFEAITLDGEKVNQDIFADYDLTMINVWATFCSPCLREMPDLGEIHREYKDKKFQIVGIVSDVLNSDGSLSEDLLKTARDIVEQTGADYTHLVPNYDLIMAKLKDVTAVPTTFFVDKEGNLVGEDIMGSKRKKDWTKIIDEQLEKVK